jgi:hypothetical protein
MSEIITLISLAIYEQLTDVNLVYGIHILHMMKLKTYCRMYCIILLSSIYTCPVKQIVLHSHLVLVAGVWDYCVGS